MYDVIVVGAGPAGNTAANSCSKKGMRTLLIEKYQLPRDKVCSGMIMGPVAHALIKEEFGELPESVLAHPSYLLGYMFHVPGIGNDKLENLTILTWRRNLDHWMNQKAQSSGVEVWHNSHVINIKKETHGFSVVIKFNKEQKEVFTKFVIGADGATSLLRRTLFPKLRVTYSQAYQEHYQWELDIDKSYFHWFYPIECSPAGFAVHQKDGLLIIDAGGRIGQKNQLIGKAKDFLAKNYHFDINQKPIWKGSCLEPIIYRE